MRGVIISAGTVTDYEYIRSLTEDTDFIVCADGGLSHCRNLDLTPDLIVGDFDSLKEQLPDDGTEILTFPAEKDYSDTHMAVMEAKKRGCDNFLLVGCSGTRLDHTLSNIGLLEALRREGIKAELVDRNNIMFSAEKHQLIHGRPGMNISFIPVDPVKGLTLRGFKYPLDKANIDLFHSIWISNVLEGEVGEVTFDSGVLIVDISND